jgi:hypothetical protein
MIASTMLAARLNEPKVEGKQRPPKKVYTNRCQASMRPNANNINKVREAAA